MKALGKKIIVKKVDSTETSSSGLITLSLSRQNKGEVLAVGTDVKGVIVGDTVLWDGMTTEVTVKGAPVVVLTEDNVLMVL